MQSPSSNKIWFLLVFVLALASCDKTRVYEKYEDIPDGIWKTDAPVGFDIEVPDTNQLYNLILNIRSTESYEYRNLYLFMTTRFPDGDFTVDTLEFLLLDEAGKPYGKCSGSVCNSKYMIDHDIRFPRAGVYRFELKQAMRTEDGTLPNIRNVGMRLEKTTGKQ